MCRQDSQTLSFEYTFVAKNIPLNIQILPKITRRYAVSGENIPFIRPIYAALDNNKPFLNGHNALHKPLNKHTIELGYFIDP